jgi:hypothetical protein
LNYSSPTATPDEFCQEMARRLAAAVQLLSARGEVKPLAERVGDLAKETDLVEQAARFETARLLLLAAEPGGEVAVAEALLETWAKPYMSRLLEWLRRELAAAYWQMGKGTGAATDRSRGHAPRSSAPRPQNMDVLRFLVIWSRELQTGGGVHGQPEYYTLPAQGDTPNDSAALKLLRACCTNYYAAETTVLAFLDAPPETQRAIWRRMRAILDAAKLAAFRDAFPGYNPAADQPAATERAAPDEAAVESPMPAAPEVVAQVPEPSTSTPSEERELKERLALAELLTTGPNASQIAAKLGVPRTTLLGWPTFREHYDRLKKDAEVRRQQHRGRKAGERDFEAGEDE